VCGLEESLPIPTETFPDPYIMIHVDLLEESYHESYGMRMLETTGRPGDYFYDINDERWNDFPCRHRHDTNVCKCKSPLYQIGQDEAVFKQNALPSHYWTVKGRSKLRPKTEGQGIMISAVFCEFRGFGLPLKPEEVEKINAARALHNILTKILPSGSPGLIFFQYGKGKEGYWDWLKFQAKCIDFLSVLEILYPTMQVLLEIDHSSGHLKEQSDGLMVNAMGLRWGGKTTPKRDTLIEEGSWLEQQLFLSLLARFDRLDAEILKLGAEVLKKDDLPELGAVFDARRGLFLPSTNILSIDDSTSISVKAIIGSKAPEIPRFRIRNVDHSRLRYTLMFNVPCK
jgi:hypothetical protein